MKAANFNIHIVLPEENKATEEEIKDWIKHQFGSCGISILNPLLHTELTDCGIYISKIKVK